MPMIIPRRTLLAAAPALLLAKPPSALQTTFSRIAAKASGPLPAAAAGSKPRPTRVGVAVQVLGQPAVYGLGIAQRYPMQSVYKLPIAMTVLAAAAKGAFQLQDEVPIEASDLVGPRQHSPLRDQHPKGGVAIALQELVRLAVSESDGSASDVLLRILGGPPTVMAYLQGLGITGLQVQDTEQELGRNLDAQYRNWATPAACLQLLAELHTGHSLGKENRQLLHLMLIESPTGAKRLKGLLPPGTAVAHKTGTSLTVEGVTAATNDIGLIPLGRGKALAMAVFVCDSPRPQEVREAVIAELAEAAYRHFGGVV